MQHQAWRCRRADVAWVGATCAPCRQPGGGQRPAAALQDASAAERHASSLASLRGPPSGWMRPCASLPLDRHHQPAAAAAVPMLAQPHALQALGQRTPRAPASAPPVDGCRPTPPGVTWPAVAEGAASPRAWAGRARAPGTVEDAAAWPCAQQAPAALPDRDKHLALAALCSRLPGPHVEPAIGDRNGDAAGGAGGRRGRSRSEAGWRQEGAHAHSIRGAHPWVKART